MFVIIRPHSNSNPTSMYRVCDIGDWMNNYNGATPSYAFTPYKTYKEAAEARDEANKSLS